MLYKIGLKDVFFHSYHGLYPEETVLGNDFVVNLSVSFEQEFLVNEQLDNSIDYGKLYDIVQYEMFATKKLLESVAESIIIQIEQNFKNLKLIEISIEKKNPPLNGIINASFITIQKQLP